MTPQEVTVRPVGDAADMAHADFAWLRMDQPTNHMMINGVMVFDEPIPFETVRAVMEQRLLHIPRFRQHVVRTGRRPQWRHDSEFDLDHHLGRSTLPAPGGDAELRETVGGLMSAPLDPTRPLWHFHLIEGYGGRAALLGRLHHCIGDGLALMMVLLSLTEVDREVAADARQNPFASLFASEPDLERALDHTKRLMPEGFKLLTHAAQAFAAVAPWKRRLAVAGSLGRLVTRRSDPKTIFRGTLGGTKRVAWSNSIPLDEVKAAGRALNGTVNDLLMTAMTGGLRRYMLERGQSPEGKDFRAAVPVSLRPLDRMATLGNEFGLVFLSLPVGIEHPVERLAELKSRMKALKRSAESLVVLGFLKALGRVPDAVQRGVVKLLSLKATAVMTNVPGPRELLYFGGVAVRDIFFWVPQSGDVGLGISIMSYAGRVRMGVTSDAELVPDPERIVDGFHEEFTAIQALGGAAGDG